MKYSFCVGLIAAALIVGTALISGCTPDSGGYYRNSDSKSVEYGHIPDPEPKPRKLTDEDPDS